MKRLDVKSSTREGACGRWTLVEGSKEAARAGAVCVLTQSARVGRSCRRLASLSASEVAESARSRSLFCIVCTLEMGLLRRDSSTLDADGTPKRDWGEKFKVYLFIECGIWLPGCYLACYRFAPTMKLMQTTSGKRAVEACSAWLSRVVPSWHKKLVELAGKIEGAPMSRAFGEWALVNKVLAPVNFPFKMWIAHKIVQRRRANEEAATILAKEPS